MPNKVEFLLLKTKVKRSQHGIKEIAQNGSKKTFQKKTKVSKPGIPQNSLKKGSCVHNGSGSIQNWICFSRMPEQPFLMLCSVNCSSSGRGFTIAGVYKYFTSQHYALMRTREWFMRARDSRDIKCWTRHANCKGFVEILWFQLERRRWLFKYSDFSETFIFSDQTIDLRRRTIFIQIYSNPRHGKPFWAIIKEKKIFVDIKRLEIYGRTSQEEIRSVIYSRTKKILNPKPVKGNKKTVPGRCTNCHWRDLPNRVCVFCENLRDVFQSFVTQKRAFSAPKGHLEWKKSRREGKQNVFELNVCNQFTLATLSMDGEASLRTF